MSKRSYLGTLALCVLVAVVFAIGLFQIFRIRLVAGDLYPEWSSLRSDPDGTRVLFDSLAATGRVVTVRKYKPLAQSPERGATILFLGYSPNSLVSASSSDLDGIRAVRAFRESARIRDESGTMVGPAKTGGRQRPRKEVGRCRRPRPGQRRRRYRIILH